MKFDNKRYWYFITQKDMGDSISLLPRTPIFKGDDEPETKRICVAPTAAHCMSALNLWSGSVYVYQTRRKVLAKKPYNVPDSHITKEHWLLTKTRFKKVTSFRVSNESSWIFGDRGFSSEESLKKQTEDKYAIVKFLSRKDERLCRIHKSNEKWFK